MDSKSLIFILFLVTLLEGSHQTQYISLYSASPDFDFFYFVQQWPGSYCNTDKSCCYPLTGKPVADFGIHGLWPNYNDGSYPSNCDPDSQFDASQIYDLLPSMQQEWPTLACPSGDGSTFWAHEWEKHGTCSESVLDEHEYFDAALRLKNETHILQALQSSGIRPDGSSYTLGSIRDAIKLATGYTPWIQCNEDSSDNYQLYQVYMCVDNKGSSLIECPIFPHGKCASKIVFPSF